MPPVLVANARKRALELLLASPRATRYTDAIGENADYAVLQEITDTAINIDLEVCGDIIDTAGHPQSSPFMFPSAALNNGDFIPGHEGAIGNVDIDDGSGYSNGLLAKSEDEIAEVLASPLVYPNPGRWYFIKGIQLYHTGTRGRVYLPQLIKTSACQAPERYENAVVWGTVQALEKDGGDANYFRKYERLYDKGRQLIRAKVLLIPDEAQMAAMIQ